MLHVTLRLTIEAARAAEMKKINVEMLMKDDDSRLINEISRSL